MSAPAGLPVVGETILGKYRLERALAEGGMGWVVEATHLQLDERVAIKFLKPSVEQGEHGEEAAQRFLLEARAVIKLRSENVVRVFDVGALESGAPYIVMELLQGADLDRLVEREGPLPVHLALEYMLQVCQALAEAHGRGIVHRDLKPANLFVCQAPDGSACVKVLDFGISKMVQTGDQGITNTQAVIGSPRYMAPEQMRDSRGVDVRADVWALGVVLYEILTGKPPFDGRTVTEVCAAILQDTPPPIGSSRSDIPEALEAVVSRCLAKEPAARYQNVAEVAADLGVLLGPGGEESSARIARMLRLEGRASGTSLPPPPFSSTSLLPPPMSSRSLLPPAPPSLPPPVSSRNAVGGATSVSWGDTGAGASSRRGTRVVIAAFVLAALLLVGVAVFVVSGRSSAPASAANPPATSASPSSSDLGAASASVPSAAASPAPQAGAPGPRGSAIAATGASASARPIRPGPHGSAGAPRPSASDLWDDRK